MTGRLDKRIEKMLFFLFGFIVTAFILIINIMIYSINIQAAKESMRSLVKENGLKNMMNAEYVDRKLDGLAFAAVRVPKKEDTDFEPAIFLNTLEGISDEELLKYVYRIPPNDKENVRLPKLIYIIKRKDGVGKVIIFISKKEAVRRCVPAALWSILAEIVSMFLLLFISKYISGILIKPVNDMFEAQKNFISNASHELKTPLAVIMANTDLLMESVGQEKHLRYIKSEAGRMNRLIIKMLELEKMDCADEDYVKEVFLLDEALLEISYPFEAVAYEKSNPFSIEIQQNMLFTGDRQQIQKAVSILLDNAFAYAAPGGSIQINACKKRHNYTIRVSNAGDEIPRNIQDRLFQRFYRESRMQEGQEEHFGLGLSISYEIVKRHHGKITVSSSQGINTFTVLLPVRC